MGSAQGRRQHRKSGAWPRGLAAALLLALLCAAPGPAWRAGAQPVVGSVSFADIEATLGQMDTLGAFFTAFAARDTNGFARERWRRLGVNYPGTAAILRDLIARDLLRIDDLPEGRSSAVLDRGEIVIDRDLDGRWGPGPPLRGTALAVQRRDLLLPELMQALARRQLSQDWPWLADHLRAVGGLAKLAEDPVARPLLARFFQAKDAYLWLALQRVGEGDPAARQALARRQTRTFNAIRALATDMAATFGAAPAERLQGDWSEYVALVDGFAVTRGWLLLDPALRQTYLGETARREAHAVNQAAAEVVASPRSAVAAARVELGRSLQARRDVAAPRGSIEDEGVNLGVIVANTPKAERAESAASLDSASLAALAASLPLATLAMRPEASGTATDPAALRAFAERLREAVEQPDPRRILAEREQQLGAAREEVATLKSRVEELATALDTRAEEAERLQSALAAERARLAAAEQRAAEEAAAAEQRLAAAEAEARAAQQRAAEEKAAAERRAAAEAAAAKQRLAAAEAEARAAQQRAAEERAAAERRVAEEAAAAERRLAAAEAEARAAQQRAADERAAAARAQAERAAAEQAAAEAAAAARQAEQRQLAEQRQAEQRQAEQRQLAEAPSIRLVPAPSPSDELGTMLTRIEQRQLYMMAAIALVFLMVMLFWLRGRRRPAVIEQPTLLLASPAQAPAPAVPRPAPAAMPARPVIDVPEEAPAARATTAAGRVNVNGVTPPTAEAKAAMKAGSARRGAAVAAASLGHEADAAAHPIVTALRKGNLPLFELLFSELTELRAPQLQRIVYGGRGEDLAIVCRAVGVDKLLFGSIYLLTDHLRGGAAEEEPERTAEILRMYDRMPPETAKKVLSKWQRNWSGDGSADEQRD